MYTFTPADDPIPWITERMRRVGVFIENPTSNRRLTDAGAAALLEVLTQCVSALHDDAKAYTVVLSADAATAGTMLEKRVVEVGSRPMGDDALTEGQKASVMAGLALHEVGHICHARQYKAALARLFGADKVTPAISTLSNLAADLHDETLVCEAYPGLAGAVKVTLWWVGEKGLLDGSDVDDMLRRGAADRVNAAIKATRYPWTVRWDTAEAREWLDWWSDWALRATATDSPKAHAEVVEEAILKVREGGREEPKPRGRGCGPIGPVNEPPKGGRPSGDDEPPTEPPTGKGKGDGKGDEPKGEEPEGGDGKGEPKPDEPKGQPKGEEPKGGQPGGDDEKPEPGDDEGGEEPTDGPGGSKGTGIPYNDQEQTGLDDACAKGKSKDWFNDQRYQHGAERVTRGKREGQRRRTYKHSSSMYGQYGGRTVVAYPRKGKRFVYDV